MTSKRRSIYSYIGIFTGVLIMLIGVLIFSNLGIGIILCILGFLVYIYWIEKVPSHRDKNKKEPIIFTNFFCGILIMIMSVFGAGIMFSIVTYTALFYLCFMPIKRLFHMKEIFLVVVLSAISIFVLIGVRESRSGLLKINNALMQEESQKQEAIFSNIPFEDEDFIVNFPQGWSVEVMNGQEAISSKNYDIKAIEATSKSGLAAIQINKIDFSDLPKDDLDAMKDYVLNMSQAEFKDNLKAEFEDNKILISDFKRVFVDEQEAIYAKFRVDFAILKDPIAKEWRMIHNGKMYQIRAASSEIRMPTWEPVFENFIKFFKFKNDTQTD